jgi:hypothetical protein
MICCGVRCSKPVSQPETSRFTIESRVFGCGRLVADDQVESLGNILQLQLSNTLVFVSAFPYPLLIHQ